MNKIKHIFIAMIFLSGLMVFVSPLQVNALTPDQERSCRQDWEGEELTTSARQDKFNKSECRKSNFCKLNEETLSGGRSSYKVDCNELTTGSGSRPPESGTDSSWSTNPKIISDCGDIDTSLINCNTTNGNPVTGILIQIINFMAIGVGIAVVGGIIWGGLVYASSNGDASKIQQGKLIIVNSVIGLLLFFFMYALINYIVPGGLFT